MNKKLVVILLSVSCVIAVWSMYQVHQSQNRVEALSATVKDMERDSRKHRSASRLTGHRSPAWNADVVDAARTAARDEARAALADHRASAPGDDDPERQAPPMAVSPDESRDRVLNAYHEEPSDPDWSADATSQLDDAVRANLPDGSHLDELACRSTMCRIELTHPDQDTHNEFLMNGFGDWRGALFVADEQSQDGRYAVTLYAAREGIALPLAPR